MSDVCTWLDYYKGSKYNDIVEDFRNYKTVDWNKFNAPNGNLVDLNNLLVWNHEDGEPIAKITNCEMVGGPGSQASLRVEAITLAKEDRDKLTNVYHGRSNGKQSYYTKIKRVIFSDPATIVFWEDGTKTVVKAHNEEFDPEKGLAMAVCKRVYGDKYHRIFKDHIPKEKPEEIENYENAFKVAADAIKELAKELNAGKENK